MQFSKIDTIVRGDLLNRQLTIHWYLQGLKYAADCLLELASDDLRWLNQVTLIVNSYGAVTIPSDCMDWVLIGAPTGRYVRPFTQLDTYNRENNYDPQGNKIPWPKETNNLNDLTYFGVPYTAWYINSYNARGENIGALYGYRIDGSPDVFQIFKERNEIQFDSSLVGKKIVLIYISDGRSVSAASRIPAYAENTIRSYIDAMFDEYDKTVPLAQKERSYNKYVGARTGLRGRLSDLTLEDIVAVIRNNYMASPKT